MRHLRITTRDRNGTLLVQQLALRMIMAYTYIRHADESAEPSRLQLHLDESQQLFVDFPRLFEGSEADEVAKALRLHRPPMRDDAAFGAMVHDDDPHGRE